MYLYSLEKSAKKHFCPRCEKKRLVRYVLNENMEYVSENVGRCDREINCAYHYTPKMYFKEHSIKVKYIPYKPQIVEIKTVSYHSQSIFKNSLLSDEKNIFIQYLYSIFNEKQVQEILQNYFIGTATFWYNGTIFWQIDTHGKIHGGKIISYKFDGKRSKYVNWVHSYLLKKKNISEFNLEQCLFGAHLVVNNERIIAIVESEKTACIMSVIFKKYVWLATGSLAGFTLKKLLPFKNNKMILYPDLGVHNKIGTPFERWNKKRMEYLKLGFDIEISDLLERKCNDEQRIKGLDIADYFTAKKTSNPIKIYSMKENIYQRMKQKNHYLTILIDVLDLNYDNL